MTSVALLLSALLLPPQSPAPMSQAPADSMSIAASRTAVRDTAADRLTHTFVVIDTISRRPRAVDVSEAYAFRLRIHHYTSYTVIPLFVLQSVSGNQLYQAGDLSKDNAWSGLHGLSAAGLGAAFTINTVTGLWNLWDSRDNADGRAKRWIHAGLLLASDAGFAYAGVKLGGEASRSQSVRDEHRKVAYISMSTALVGYAIMLIGDH